MIKDMKTRISKLNIDFDFEDYWEIIYLILLAFFVGMRFLLSTMFTIYWPKYFYRTLTVIGVVLVLLHLMMAKDISKKEIAAMLVVTFVFMMSHYVSGYDFLVDLLILILGAYRVNFRNILKTYIAVWSVLLVVTIIGAMTGLAENLVYYQGEGGERVRMALGICYPTDLAAYVAFLMFAYVCVRDEYITYLEIGVMVALAGAVYYITDARTDFIVMEMLVVVVLLTKKFFDKFTKILLKIKYAIACLPVVLCLINIILCMQYKDGDEFWDGLDKLLTNRLWWGRYVLQQFPIKTFGQYIYEKGSGGTTEFPYDYFFIDSSYLSIMLKYGLGVLILILSVLIMKILENIEKKDAYFIVVIIILCLQSVMEHHMVQYWYNPFLLMWLTHYKDGKDIINLKQEKNQYIDLN